MQAVPFLLEDRLKERGAHYHKVRAAGAHFPQTEHRTVRRGSSAGKCLSGQHTEVASCIYGLLGDSTWPNSLAVGPGHSTT